MSDTTTPTPPTPSSQPPTPPSAKARRWPRRLLIGVLGLAVLLGAAFWVLGREATLQIMLEKISAASGGQIAVSDVSGSLYGTMHLGHVSYRSASSNITAVDVDIAWSPLQYFSQGIKISRLSAASLSIESIGPSTPAVLPQTLAPPFQLAVNDLRLGKLTLFNEGEAAMATVITDLRLALEGDPDGWRLSAASAATPWGLAQAEFKIAATSPFALDGKASLTQAPPQDGTATSPAAQLKATLRGNLSVLEVAATATSAHASGDAALTLAPFDPIILRKVRMDGRDIDPAGFNPAWPQAKLNLHIAASIAPDQAISGQLSLTNQGKPGPLDQQLLPFRSVAAQLGGTLTAARIDDLLLDLAAAGKVSGAGTIARAEPDAGIGSATVKLKVEGIDLKAIQGTLNATGIDGVIELGMGDGKGEGAGKQQTLNATLSDKNSRLNLDLRATLADALLQVQQLRINAGKGRLSVTGQAHLDEQQQFSAKASASQIDPSVLGAFPAGDINGDLTLSGQLLPQWQMQAKLALRPSRLLAEALDGSASLKADATHVSDVAVNLTLGRNLLTLKGDFGAPGEQLAWNIDGKQLNSVRSDLVGSLAARGIIDGSFAAPRSSFSLDARNLGLRSGPAANANAKSKSNSNQDGGSRLQASGVAGLNAEQHLDVTLKATARSVNPAAFGPYASGSINGDLQAEFKTEPGADWRTSLKLALQPSTLSGAPLAGNADIVADARHITKLDIDLKLGPNSVQASGSFGAARDRLDWTIAAPQLASLGAQFGGALQGSGTLAGTVAAPELTLALTGNDLRLFGIHTLKTLRASARIDAGASTNPAAGDQALVSDIALSGYRSPALTLADARLQTSGTRAAHRLQLSARNDDIDAAAEIRGSFGANAWNGTLASLTNRGRHNVSLQAPAPIRIVGPANGGLAGLLTPVQLSLANAVLIVPGGSVSLQKLEKSGALWSSNGKATGVALSFLAPRAWREMVRSDLTLGAAWALKLQAASGLNPKVDGMLHVYREKGDVAIKADGPLALGLSLLDARIDVQANALRMQLAIDGVRAGNARLDATAQLVDGRIANDSALRATASANMPSLAWLAPLAGQPGLDLDGALTLALRAGGTISAPALNGDIKGDKLTLDWDEHGVKLKNGQLVATLSGDQLLLQRLSFDGVEGRAQLDGWLRFANAEASMQLSLMADKLQVMGRPDRTLVVSGNSKLVRDQKRFQLDGKFKADRASIELASQDTPTMSDDVIIVGKAGAKAPAPGLPLNIDVEIDLGERFRLQGMGLDAILAGNVRVRALERRAPTVLGSIRTVRGTYAAYGQKLSIERGVLNFTSAYDNPGLNILAVRKRPEGTALTEANVEAGVEVRGTALSPTAKLVSTPNVPDSDKLSWLVLGHGPDGGGGQAGLLSSAAGALFGGSGGGGSLQQRMADTLGLDEVGLTQQASGAATGLETTVVTVGKRLSRRAYVSFEQGVGTASSLVKLRYKLNERISLQFQTGANSAFDVLYSWTFD
jgi:translocation and assembly module TamB